MMVNRRTVAALLVFAAVAVNGQTMPPTGGGCTPVAPVWNCTANMHQRGGKGEPAGTDQGMCAKACNDNPACTGYDWDPTNAGTKCWIHEAKGSLFDAPGVTHCELTTRGVDCQQECQPTWTEFPDKHIQGGTPSPTAGNAGIVACQAECLKVSTCAGIDWDPSNTQKCWLTPDKAKNNAPGVTHYDLNRGGSCSSGCIATVHVEGSTSADDEYVSISEDNGCLQFTRDRNQAAVFTKESCPMIPTVNETLNCTRFKDARSNLYVRGMPNGRLCMMSQPPVLQTPIDPFVMHTSFIVTNQGFTTYEENTIIYFDVNSVILNNFFMDPDPAQSTVGFFEGDGSSRPVNYWKCLPGTVVPPIPIPDKCPNVWSKIDHAKPSAYTEGSFDECRKPTIDKGAPGVSIDKCADPTTCQFANKNSYLVHDFNSSYYDRWNPPLGGTCPRGCSYWWNFCSRVLDCWSTTVYLWKTRKEDNLYKCQEYCVNHSPPCVGVYYDSGTKDCKLLTATQIDDQSSIFPATTADVWKLVPRYTGCGRCISSIGHFCGYNDTTAESTLAVGDDGCLTICLNNPNCLGYIVRGGMCFITTLKNFTLNSVANSDLVYNAVYRSPCGNGCVHRWRLYAGSKIKGNGTYKMEAKTERECRIVCIADTGCTGIDWHMDTNRCILDTENQMLSCARDPNVNHFQLIRNDDCEAGEYCGHDHNTPT